MNLIGFAEPDSSSLAEPPYPRRWSGVERWKQLRLVRSGPTAEHVLQELRSSDLARGIRDAAAAVKSHGR
jgi:hypothetical protein